MEEIAKDSGEEKRSISGVSVELSEAGQKAQRDHPENRISASGGEAEAYQGMTGLPYGANGYKAASYRTPFGTYLNPQEAFRMMIITRRCRGISILSIVMAGLSFVLFWIYGIGIVPSLAAVIMGLISMISGRYTTRYMGAIGFVFGLAGFSLNAIFLLILYEPVSRRALIEWFGHFYRMEGLWNA